MYMHKMLIIMYVKHFFFILIPCIYNLPLFPLYINYTVKGNFNKDINPYVDQDFRRFPAAMIVLWAVGAET